MGTDNPMPGATDSLIAWIDQASLEDLLRKWRFAKPGSFYLQGEVGEHFKNTLFRRRDEAGDAEWTRLSKKIGW